jgi:NADPH-dependent 2,4-dienoyl-CoA reductase/sulfur reductase-like enzyme
MNADLIIVGGGPAGVSAAIEARARGLSVLLLDENAAPGGRIWQALEVRGAKDADDAAALDLLKAFRACGAAAHWGATVWTIEPDGVVYWSEAGASHSARGAKVLLATGTTERPVPIPGWTLPGVMTVGAAQIALKTGELVPAGQSWIAGQGPLVLLYAVQALRAGGRLAGILDLSDPAARWPALKHLPRALSAFRDLWKGVAWQREIARAGVPWIRASDLRAVGEGALREIAFRAGGETRCEPADLLLLHDGVIPSVQITRALFLEHEWSASQRSWRSVTDAWGVSSVPNILVAGDGAGIGGALAATCAGRIAALGAVCALGKIDVATRDTAAAPWRAAQARYNAVRPLLDTLYRPLPKQLDDATLVCRCEEVTAGQLRTAARIGALGMNQLKAFTRCGMGPCQGRMCGATAIEVMALARGVPVEQIEPLRTRFPTKPITRGEIAALTEDA